MSHGEKDAEIHRLRRQSKAYESAHKSLIERIRVLTEALVEAKDLTQVLGEEVMYYRQRQPQVHEFKSFEAIDGGKE